MRTTAAAGVAAGLLLSLAGCATQAVPQSLSPQELREYIEATQELQWFYSDRTTQTRPDVRAQLVKAPDFDDVMRACIRARELTEAQCAMTYLQYPSDVGYLGRAQLGYIYDYFADSLVPCLAGHGLAMTYVPTRDEFTVAAGYIWWDPYGQLGADLPPSRAAAIIADCPRYPAAGGTWH